MEWKEYKLGDIASCELGKMLDQKKNTGKPQLYLNNVAVRWGSFDINRNQTMLFEEKEAERFQIKKGDIVVCEGGEPGRCAIWTEEYPIYYQKALHRVRVKEPNSNFFLYYYLRHLFRLGLADSFMTGTTIKHLPREAMLKIPLKLPSIADQRRIAAILSSLDRKIELNNQINKTLEEMAQAIFKNWFVDFGPFQDGEFVESELGLIPKGWRVGTLSEVALINPSLKLPKGTEATYLDMSNMPTNGSFPSNWEKKVYNGGMKFQKNDTLMARITPCLENGKVCYANFLEGDEVCFGSTEYIVMRPINGEMPELFYYLCRDERFVGYATKNMNGSSGRQRVSGETIGNYKIAIPPYESVSHLAPIFHSIMEKIRNNGLQNRTLAHLRDTLLPKLMSGEIALEALRDLTPQSEE